MAKASGVVAAAASEEEEDARAVTPGAPYLLLFDPLDGSSNIDVNVSIGTIFSVLPARAGEGAAPFLQPGRNQVAAGYCVYGPQTTLVLTLGSRRRRLHHGPADRPVCADRRQHPHPGEDERVRDQHVEHAPLGRSGARLCRRMPRRRHRPARQELQHALDRLDGRRRPPRTHARRRLHVSVGQARTRQARQAPPDVRSQPDVAPRRTGRRQILRRQTADPRHRSPPACTSACR